MDNTSSIMGSRKCSRIHPAARRAPGRPAAGPRPDLGPAAARSCASFSTDTASARTAIEPARPAARRRAPPPPGEGLDSAAYCTSTGSYSSCSRTPGTSMRASPMMSSACLLAPHSKHSLHFLMSNHPYVHRMQPGMSPMVPKRCVAVTSPSQQKLPLGGPVSCISV